MICHECEHDHLPGVECSECFCGEKLTPSEPLPNSQQLLTTTNFSSSDEPAADVHSCYEGHCDQAAADEARDTQADVYAKADSGMVDPTKWYAFTAGFDAAVRFLRGGK